MITVIQKSCFFFFKCSVLCPFIPTCRPFILHLLQSARSRHTSYYTYCSVFVIIIFFEFCFQSETRNPQGLFERARKKHSWRLFRVTFQTGRTRFRKSFAENRWKVLIWRFVFLVLLKVSVLLVFAVANPSSDPLDTNVFHQSEVPL